MRTVRLFSILDHLRGRRTPISADALAQTLGVSVRTIYRDMGTLQSMGAPIRGEGGVGYQIEDGYFLPPLHFDPDELDALILGIRMVTARGDEDMGDAAARALGKIESVLSEERRRIDQPLLAVGGEQNETHSTGLSTLRKAIRERRKARLNYRDGNNRQTKRVVRPLGMIAFETVWIVTAWCESRDDFRNFRLDRITALAVTDIVFKREPGKEFSDYLRSL